MKQAHEIVRSVKLIKIGDDSSNKSGQTNKFWQAKIIGNILIATWGPNGTPGRTQQYVLDNIYAARNKIRETVQSKLKKNYKMVYSF